MASRICVTLSVLCALIAVRGSPVTPPTPTPDAVLVSAHPPDVMASVCVNMNPGHPDSQPMSGIAPYAIQLSHSHAAPGDTIQVKSIGIGSEAFKGVYIQGRHGDVPVGQFIYRGEANPAVSVLTCPPGEKNAASYISRSPISEFTLDYVVPADVSEIIFKATFVKSYAHPWASVQSTTLLVSKHET